MCPAPWWMSHEYEVSLEAEAQLAAEEAAEDAEEASPFLMLNAAEARAAGFRADEEVVMPMPVFSDSEEDS